MLQIVERSCNWAVSIAFIVVPLFPIRRQICNPSREHPISTTSPTMKFLAPMATLHHLLGVLSSDPFATLGFLLLIILLCTLVILVFVFARRSTNDLRYRAQQRVCTDEQRSYWITRRRQRFVAMWGGYPDMLAPDSFLYGATRRGNVVQAPRNEIRLNPVKRKRPYAPVFAPRGSPDDVFNEVDRLEAAAGLSPAMQVRKAASEGHLTGLKSP